MQFTACQEYVDFVERARDLLSHAVSDRSLAEVHLRAMRLLVAELEKRKFAVSGEPRRRGVRGKKEAAVSAGAVSAGSKGAELGDEERRPGETSTAEIEVNEVSPSETSRDRIDAHELSPGETQPEAIDTAVIGAAGTNEDTSAKPPSPENIDTMKNPHRCHLRGTSSPAEGTAETARYVPAPVRREVFARDRGRCAFVSADGVRCRETRLLELHP